MYFSKYAKKVTMLVRAESLKNSMSKYLIDQIAGTSNIEVKACCQVVEALGETRLSCLRLCGPERRRNRAGKWIVHFHRGGAQHGLASGHDHA